MSEFLIENGVLMAYTGPGGAVTVPEGVTEIEAMAFAGCSRMTEVHIPESVTTIGIAAFHGCSRLTEVTLPAGLRRLERWAFRGCEALRRVTLLSAPIAIGDEVFGRCEALTEITLSGDAAAPDPTMRRTLMSGAEGMRTIRVIADHPGERTEDKENEKDGSDRRADHPTAG